MAVFSRFWPFLVQFFIVTHIYGQTMYILQKNCPQTSFPGGKEAPNILHSGKMLAPHFKDEIASLQKLPFLAGFWPFLEQFFLLWLIFIGKQSTFCKKNCPQMSFPGCRKAPNIFHPPFERSPPPTQLTKSKSQESVEYGNQLTNWQIQVTRVSWVWQSTRFKPLLSGWI